MLCFTVIKVSSRSPNAIKDMSSITQMGIINIENDSLSKISPAKRDSVQMNNKIIEEVSEENQSQSATSVKLHRNIRDSLEIAVYTRHHDEPTRHKAVAQSLNVVASHAADRSHHRPVRRRPLYERSRPACDARARESVWAAHAAAARSRARHGAGCGRPRTRSRSQPE